MTNSNEQTLFLRYILEKDKLNETNFVDWYKNLRTVLKSERKLYVLEGPLPMAPSSRSTMATREAFKRHYDDSHDVAYLMLSTMVPELWKPLAGMVCPYKISEHLKGKFAGLVSQYVHNATMALITTKLPKEDPVAPHALEFMGNVERLEAMGCDLDHNLVRNLFLQSLPDVYFPLIEKMNKENKSLAELLNMIRVAEMSIKRDKPIRPALFEGKKGKSKREVSKAKGGVTKGRKCFYCGMTGHLKRDCKAYLEDNKKGGSTFTSGTLS